MQFLHLTIKALLLIMPVVIAGILHMLAVKKDILPRIKIPIHASLLGRNKTYRGLLLMPTLTVCGTVILYAVNGFLPNFIRLSLGFLQAVQLGILLGLAYALFELPNSFLKRRAGIPPGKSADKFTLPFRLLDLLDSTLGCLLVFHLFLKLEFTILILILVLGIAAHALTTNALYLLRIREERW
jgi:hypothetical protein